MQQKQSIKEEEDLDPAEGANSELRSSPLDAETPVAREEPSTISTVKKSVAAWTPGSEYWLP